MADAKCRMKDVENKIFTLLFISVFASIGFANQSDEIKTVCGGRARVVWCQDAGDGSDAGAEGNSLRLMGFDTDDGRGERCILPGPANYAKPMLTPDGSKIIFSSRPEQKIYLVGFDGSGLKSLASGFALDVWRDSLTETDWVYAGTLTNQPDSLIVNVRRFRLDKPEVNEPVWSKTPLNIDNFQLSASGRYACGVFPWPACGVAVLPDRDWTKYGDGCWPSLAPGGVQLFWIFDGAHRNLTVLQTATGKRWVVNINSAPGIDGFEVYHPRWSNHPLFMGMTGPYKIGTNANRIRGGGKDVEIYLGKFAQDFKKIERWIQVTHNQSADFFPDLWLAASKERQAGQVLAEPSEIWLQENKKTSIDAWPVSYEGLVFFWQNKSKANMFAGPAGQVSQICRVEAKGRARFGRHFEMEPAGGAFIADGGAGELAEKYAENGQLAVEALITPENGNFNLVGSPLVGDRSAGRHAQARPLHLNSAGKTNLLPIVGYSTQSGEWNFLLGQQGQQLIFKIRAAKGGPDYVIPLGAVADEEPIHVIISCSASNVAYYLNGEQIFSKDAVYGGNWTSALREPPGRVTSSPRPETETKAVEPRNGKIVFGNELRAEYPVNMENEKTGWRGLIENAALYSRWIGPEEAHKKHQACLEKINGRKQLPVLSVKAGLISMPVIPSPESIAPYRRALAVGHYKIEEVTAGTCSNREIMVARWAILDGQVLNSAGRRNGETCSLALDLFSGHPELEGERLIMEGDRFDLPMYYETEGR